LGLFGDPLNRPTVEFLQIAATNNPDRAERGAATFARACLTKREADDMAFWVNMPPSIYTNAAAQATRATFLEEAKTRGPEAILHEAEQLFQTVKTDYSDVPNFLPGPGLRQPELTLGGQASIELYECEHLTVGKVVPEIQGENIEGHKLRLSDYRGKVVLVSFWASWCGPCMQMVPHERAIAERLAGKPFVLIGVNGDSEKTAAERAMAEQKMTWQSFWNGGNSEGGIAGAWNVHAWPTVYVLDSKGTIRLKLNGYGGKKTDALLDAVVDKLLED
jgi:thiol-disulfide isomerase/thioredoxin